MAVRDAVVTGPTDDGLYVIEWAGLLNGDTGEPVRLPFYAGDKTVQVIGTFGVGGNINMEGSNADAPGASDWGQVHDAAVVLMALSTTVPFVIAETTMWVRPKVTAGDGTTDLTCIIVAPVKGK